MMMIMMMVMMLPSRRRGRLRADRSRSRRFLRWSILGNTTDGAEPVFRGVQTATGEAGARLRSFCYGTRGIVRVRLRSKSLYRLESSGDGFGAGLGVMQVLLQPPEEIVDRGVVGKFSLGPSRGRISCRPGLFFMIHRAAQ